MLFADGTFEEEAPKWIGPILTSVAGFFASLFAWLSARDNMRKEVELKKIDQDARLTKAEAKIEHLTAVTADCHKDRDEQKQEIDELRRRLDNRSDTHRPLTPTGERPAG